MARISKLTATLSGAAVHRIPLVKGSHIVSVGAENDKLVLFVSAKSIVEGPMLTLGRSSTHDFVDLYVVKNGEYAPDEAEYIGSVVLNSVDRHVFIWK